MLYALPKNKQGLRRSPQSLFGVVWMIEPESLDSESARSFARGLLKAVIAHQYQK
jgi:hypothetical protein